jgi:hypothetical protein
MSLESDLAGRQAGRQGGDGDFFDDQSWTAEVGPRS